MLLLQMKKNLYYQSDLIVGQWSCISFVQMFLPQKYIKIIQNHSFYYDFDAKNVHFSLQRRL